MIHLIIGGARSGKSSYAEKVAKNNTKKNKGVEILYIATSTAKDDEMKERIKKHKQSRPKHWKLIEEPMALAQVISNNSASNKVIIIECMTLWLSNWLCSQHEANNNWDKEKQSFLTKLTENESDIIIVSNEVGSGIVPMGELSREFVDQSGWLNQELAIIADNVTLVVAGLPVFLKSSL